MPDLISVSDFVTETNEDFKAPTTSSFTTRMPECRSTVTALEEGLDSDASLLLKIKKSLKAIHSSGMAHIESQEQYFQSLEKFGQRFLSKDDDCEIGSAFLKFYLLTKELTALFKNLVQNMNNIIFFPLESLLKGDLKGVKGDLRKSFDKAWKDYEAKLAKIEKEKKEHAKQHGLIRTEINAGEIAEDMEKERQMFQLQMCEYFLKVNEIQVKKGVNFVQNLIKYFQIQGNFFQEGLKAVEDLKPSVEKLASNLVTIKQNQDGERKQLTQLRDTLKASLQAEQKEDLQVKQSAGYSLHQLQGDKVYGTERDGVLYKRSEGLRRVWQKRRCFVKNGFLSICHGTSNRDPAKLNLLTCQVKRNPDEKKSFDLFSHDRIYHFQAEDEVECQIWVSVLQNSKEEALNDAFKGGSNEGENNIVQELTKSIVEEVKKMSGNDRCCDCGAAGPSWLSTNLGVLICIECSGIHREIGVHYSRIQSLDLDVLGTSEMLLANNVGNASFNGIMEVDLGARGITKPDPSSDMQTRKEYITAKYTEKRFARRLCASPESRLKALYEAVRNKDVLSLLQVYAEGVDLMEAVPQPNEHEHGETVLHLAVRMADRNSLHIVDFLAQNSPNLDKQTAKGNTALHYCCLRDNRECLKLLLRGRASVSIINEAGETPLDIAKRLQHSMCEELLTQVQTGKFNVHVHVEYQWRLQNEELDESEDEMEEKPIPSRRDERPVSCFVASGALQPNLAALARDAASMVRDKQRPPIPSSIISNETYGTAMDLSLPPLGPSPPPLPYRGLNKGGGTSGVGIGMPEVGRQRSLSDPPNAPITEKNSSALVLPVAPPVPINSGSILLETKTLSAKNSPLPPVPSPPAGPPPIPPAPSLPPPPIQKPPPLPPHVPNYKISRPLGPPAPKPPMSSPGLVKEPPLRPPVRSGSVGKSGLQSKSPQSPAPPLPKPRKNISQQKPKRVKAIYNCFADQPDELTFKEGEVIVVEGEEDHEWWIGHVEGDPGRRGVFPVTFVHFISE